MAGLLTKSELAAKYGITVRTLAKLLNVRYFDELAAVGYEKSCKYLSPKVIQKFFEFYGEPLNDNYE